MRIEHKSIVGCICLLLITSTIKSQVTIGFGDKPATGALLQLKENNKPDENSTKGLGLPRVELTKPDHLYPMFENNSDYISKKDAYDTSHTGLLVYHISSDPRPECATLPSGIYVWDGLLWVPLSPGGQLEFSTLEHYDENTKVLTDRSGYTYHTAEFGTAGRWMTQNLRTMFAPSCDNPIHFYDGTGSLIQSQKHYPGTQGGEQVSPSTWSAEQGMLYNWHAATNGYSPASTSQQQEASTTPGVNMKWKAWLDLQKGELYKEFALEDGIYLATVNGTNWKKYLHL